MNLDALRWALDAMGRAVKAMHHASNDTELCQLCCDAITADSAYPLAWVGFAVNDEAHSINIAAQSGAAVTYLDGIQVTWGDEPSGRGPGGTAIRTGKSQVVDNTLTNPVFTPWLERASKAGFQSSVAIPLVDGSECFGALMVYSGKPGAFDADAISLLENLASVIGFGVNLYRTTSIMLSERQKATELNEEKLRTLQLLNTIADSSNEAIFAKDMDGRYLLFNRETLRQNGKSREEVIGKKDDEVFASEVAAGIRVRDQLVMNVGHVMTFEESLATVDGERTFLTTKGPMIDDSGNVFGLFGISRDITERKLIETALQKSEERYRRFAEELPLGIVITQEGRIKYVNSATIEMIGHSGDELHDSFFLPFVYEPDRPWMMELHQRRMKGENIESPYLVRMVRKDGAVRQWQIHTSTIEWDGHLSALGIIADITERKQAEEELRIALAAQNEAQRRAQNSELRYKTLIQHAADAVFVFDFDARFIEVNQQACDSLGYAREELLGMGVVDIVPGFDLASRQPVWRKLEVGKPYSITSAHRRKDGSLFPVELRIATLEIDDKKLLMALVSDITVRVNAEKQLRDSFRLLEEKELAKTRFLAAAGHDLRQPVAAANLFVDALKLTSPSQRQGELIERLDQSMTIFSGLLERLLDISKLDAGLVKPQLTSFNLMELFNWLEQNFAQIAHDKRLRFQLFFPMNRQLIVHTDIALLQSVLMNLVSNAIKFTARGGILIGVRLRGGKVLLQVWDTGIGIAEANLPHIFDEFYQVANPQRNREDGLGLGLSICQRAMLLLGEKIACRSRPGRGSVFELKILLSNEQYALGLLPDNDISSQVVNLEVFRNKRIVVLEDDGLVAVGLTDLLQEMGGSVRHFQSAEQALQYDDVINADFFVVDYSLGGELSGLDFLAQVQQKLGAPIRAAILTGETSSEFIRSIYNSPWPVLHKPISFDKLVYSLDH